MIERVIINGYRCFKKLDFKPNSGMNIIVGDNEAGKSTLLEAIALALTSKVNNNWATDELNPYWFNTEDVATFFRVQASGESSKSPTILIEIYFADEDKFQRLRGVHNSLSTDAPGVRIHIRPSDQYAPELSAYLESSPPKILPVEFYEVDWRDFGDRKLTQRPKELALSYIDSRTVRSTSGVDYHTREMVSGHLDAAERAIISVAHRRSKQDITDNTLQPINTRIAAANAALHDKPIGLQMDQSARSSWETGIVPQVAGIPFAMAGQGQQAARRRSRAVQPNSAHLPRRTTQLDVRCGSRPVRPWGRRSTDRGGPSRRGRTPSAASAP